MPCINDRQPTLTQLHDLYPAERRDGRSQEHIQGSKDLFYNPN